MKKLLTFFAAVLLSLSVWAWPTRPITLIVPYPPGGLVDKFARSIQKDFQDRVSFPVEVQYMPGAAIAVATTHVLGRANDNHTFIIADAGFVGGRPCWELAPIKSFSPLT